MTGPEVNSRTPVRPAGQLASVLLVKREMDRGALKGSSYRLDFLNAWPELPAFHRFYGGLVHAGSSRQSVLADGTILPPRANRVKAPNNCAYDGTWYPDFPTGGPLSVHPLKHPAIGFLLLWRIVVVFGHLTFLALALSGRLNMLLQDNLNILCKRAPFLRGKLDQRVFKLWFDTKRQSSGLRHSLYVSYVNCVQMNVDHRSNLLQTSAVYTHPQ